jgi:hypothetical protein
MSYAIKSVLVLATSNMLPPAVDPVPLPRCDDAGDFGSCMTKQYLNFSANHTRWREC